MRRLGSSLVVLWRDVTSHCSTSPCFISIMLNGIGSSIYPGVNVIILLTECLRICIAVVPINIPASIFWQLQCKIIPHCLYRLIRRKVRDVEFLTCFEILCLWWLFLVSGMDAFGLSQGEEEVRWPDLEETAVKDEEYLNRSVIASRERSHYWESCCCELEWTDMVSALDIDL